ncbi:MAG: hypothetical protein VKK07_04435 [Merismopediaceae bacterium]|nr:hypothetical protein [Merismopediaceae bacterium]
MLGFLQLLTPSLTFFSLVFIVAPSIVAISVRISLYNYLTETTRLLDNVNEKRIEKIRIAFKEASKKLDKVNTISILEEFYHEEKFSLLGFKLPCESWDYFTRSLPNLLISFGLLGTFLGITLNLKDISGIINQEGMEASLIVNRLQGPLQSMGIAFISSLVAIIFSSTITILNFIFNTELAKNKLFIRLENYLENNHSFDEDKNLSRVNTFIGQLEILLTSILYQDEQSPDKRSIEGLLKNLLQNTQSSISQNITDFQNSILTFSEQVKLFKQGADSIQESFSRLENGAETFKQSSIDIQKAVIGIQQHQNTLWEWRNKLAETQEEFAKTTKVLGSNIKSLIENNKKATDLAENVYEQLQESSRQFQDSSLGFMEASEIIRDSKFADKLLKASEQLEIIQNRFFESSTVLSSSTQSIAGLIQDFQLAITQVISIGENIKNLNQQSQELLRANETSLTEVKDDFQTIESNLVKLISGVKKYQEASILGLQKVGSYITNSVVKQMENNSVSLQGVTQVIQEYSSHIQKMQGTFEQLVTHINQVDSQSSLKVQTLANLSNEISSLHQKSINFLELNYQQLAAENNELNQIKSELSELSSTLRLYQEDLNIKPEISNFSDQLIDTITEQFRLNSQALGEIVIKEGGKNKQDILNLYSSIEQSLLNLREVNNKLTNLLNLANQLADSSK